MLKKGREKSLWLSPLLPFSLPLIMCERERRRKNIGYSEIYDMVQNDITKEMMIVMIHADTT